MERLLTISKKPYLFALIFLILKFPLDLGQKTGVLVDTDRLVSAKTSGERLRQAIGPVFS